MEIEIRTDQTISDLVKLRKEDILRVNHEYQRGLRWTLPQQQMFLDSIFRGYSIPAFYFHKNTKSAGGFANTYLDIVDGQQRINAIYKFSEGNFPLLDPSAASGIGFPNFVKDEPCPWAGKRQEELSEELKGRMGDQQVVVYEITTENEIRDLFIRLQGGTPLTPQDKRDSWPGNFTEFVLRVGGKADVPKWPGDPVFLEIAKFSNESRRRQLAAQIFMILWSLKKEMKFCDIKSANIDEFYHHHVDFSGESAEAKRFREIGQKLHALLNGGPRQVGHYLIHLFLLVDSLLDEFVSGSWEHNLSRRLAEFDRRRVQAINDEKNRQDSEFRKYYTEYGRWTQTQSDMARTIMRRHAFFMQEMLELLSPKRLDPKRGFSEIDRKIVFFRDMELCQQCRMRGDIHRVAWGERQIHHVKPYSQGGPTSIGNAVLVHRDCHPKGQAEVKEMEDWWLEFGHTDTDLQPRKQITNLFPPPENTKAKFKYKGREHRGIIKNGKLVLEDRPGELFNSFSGASSSIVGKNRNGWTDWYLLLPGSEIWLQADEWRRNSGGPRSQLMIFPDE